MYAVTDPHPEGLPAEPKSGNEVSCSFVYQHPAVWVGTCKCKHGQSSVTTYLSTLGTPPNPTQMVTSAYRQHEIMVHCDCPPEPARLNATLTYGTSPAVAPGERRIIAETGATIPASAKKTFSYYGRLTCMQSGAFLIDAKLQLGQTVAAGARGSGQVFAAGTPAMLSAPMEDVASVATALPTGLVNLYPNQPLAIAFTNTGTTNQDVQLVTLTVSEVWIP